MPQTRDDRYHGGMRCEYRIDAGVMAFPCTLPRDHDGPHYAMESARSRHAREEWEKEQEAKAASSPEPTHDNCLIGHAHEGPCQPPGGVPEVHTIKAETHPAGGYFVTLPNGDRVHLTEENLVERPSRVIGVQDSLKQLLDKESQPVAFMGTVGETGDDGFIKIDMAPPTKQREGDQPLPDGNLRTQDVQSMVIADIMKRREIGIQRYGQALRIFNGRNAIQDLYEELIDAAIYTRALLEMRDATRGFLVDIVEAQLASMPLVNPNDPAHHHQAVQVVDRIIDSLVIRAEDADV